VKVKIYFFLEATSRLKFLCILSQMPFPEPLMSGNLATYLVALFALVMIGSTVMQFWQHRKNPILWWAATMVSEEGKERKEELEKKRRKKKEEKKEEKKKSLEEESISQREEEKKRKRQIKKN
jgi:hypothetical protein